MPLSQEAIQDVVARISTTGWATLQLEGSIDDLTGGATEVLAALGNPLHAYVNFPFWKPIDVDLDKAPGRVCGVGLNSMHLDCINAVHPPDYVALVCVRADPQGGGANVIVDTRGIQEALTPETVAVLRNLKVSVGTMDGLTGVGGSANPFPVLSDGDFGCRYSGRLLESPDRDGFVALLELDRVLMQRAATVSLNDGEVAFIDQRHVLHGRLSLGHGQESVPAERRRLIVQAYSRDAGSH